MWIQGKNWTLHRLAEESGVPENTIWRLESGITRHGHRETAERIAEALGVAVDDLYGDVSPDAQVSDNTGMRRTLTYLFDHMTVENRLVLLQRAMELTTPENFGQPDDSVMVAKL